MTQSLRRKIIRYQSDLGANILRKQSQGLNKLNYTFEYLQKKFAFDKVRTKWVEIELIGNKAADIFDKKAKQEFLHKWIESLKF